MSRTHRSWALLLALVALVVLVAVVLVVWVFPPGHSAEVRNSTPDFVVLATSGGQVRALDPDGGTAHGGGVWLVSIGNRCTWHDAGSTVEHRTGSNDRDTWTRYANSARIVVDSCWTATWR